MNFIGETLSFLSSDPLFSTIFSLYSLALLYSPSPLLQFIFSPVVFTTLILLLYLLRLGATTQNSAPERNESDSIELIINSTESLPRDQIEDSPDLDQKCDSWTTASDTVVRELGSVSDYEPNSYNIPNQRCPDSFVEWNVRARLEVIYEEHEDGDGAVLDASEMNVIQRYASLSLFYPDSDSDASSEGDWNSPESVCFRWEEDDDDDGGGGLIEIELDGKRRRNVEVDEENLIEIDLRRDDVAFPASLWKGGC